MKETARSQTNNPGANGALGTFVSVLYDVFHREAVLCLYGSAFLRKRCVLPFGSKYIRNVCFFHFIGGAVLTGGIYKTLSRKSLPYAIMRIGGLGNG